MVATNCAGFGLNKGSLTAGNSAYLFLQVVNPIPFVSFRLSIDMEGLVSMADLKCIFWIWGEGRAYYNRIIFT